jgi:hypothetical protein
LAALKQQKDLGCWSSFDSLLLELDSSSLGYSRRWVPPQELPPAPFPLASTLGHRFYFDFAERSCRSIDDFSF